ncbi:MAG: 2-hydroxyacyl-CoA dehydratase, partial [bacterium]|nr:2-hydroxyacyl-CoA dehydratase [bacterium]
NEYKVDAVIVERLEFCTLMASETFMFKNEANKVDVPIMALDRELYGGGTGQIKTRVQAFFEQVKNKKAYV